jgi:hypothetical protein
MASSTDIAETAQAMFCALADYVGSTTIKGKLYDSEKNKKINNVFDVNNEDNNTYTKFISNWSKKYPKVSIENIFNNYVSSGKVTFDQIENFLIGKGPKDKTANDWYKSSVLIGKYLILEITKISREFKYIQSSQWKKIFYAHQDNKIMNNIQILFSEANKNQKEIKSKLNQKTQIPFGNLNKWSPADIYLSSPKAEKEIENLVKNKKNLTFTGKNGLNQFIGNLIKEGQLLPLSLKKTTKAVTLVKVNFNRATEEREINLRTFGGLSNWKPYNPNGSNNTARDLKVYVNTDKSEYVSFRHDPATTVTKGKPEDFGGGAFRGEVQVKGASAKAGGLGTGQIESILNLCDPKRGRFGTLFVNKLEKAKFEFNKQRNPVRKVYEDAGAPSSGPIREEYDKQVGELSATLVTNKVMPYLIKFLKDPKRAEAFARWVWTYATSRQTLSSKFVIAKGS